MKNLRNLGHWFQSGPDGTQAPCCCAWDTSNNDIICAYGPSKSDTLVTLQRWTTGSGEASGSSSQIASWDAPEPSPNVPCDQILDIHYFPDNLSTCIVFAGGDVVIVRESPQSGQEKIEILGSVDIGIAATAWAPDEELLIILTNAATLLYMSREFESITEVTLSQEDLKASKHVSVGWGKAETQFRGKGAKALRDPTMPEKIDQGLLSLFDQRNSTISWRGDGAYVAINTLQESDRRIIRVYSRDGELDGVTEPVDYLDSALSWRPAGNLMAGVQRLTDRIDIVFFERNGLRHGQFSLRLSIDEIETEASRIELKWNQDSTILAVCLRSRIQLWTMGNYHYYLKQEVFHQGKLPPNSLPFFTWHPEQALLFSIGHAGYVQKSEYGWHHANGTNIQPFDIGLTSIIDGRILKITPLKLSNIPPPMSYIELETSDNIVDVAYFDTPDEKDSMILVAILDNWNISVYSWNPREVSPSKPKLQSKRPVLDDSAQESSQHLRFRQVGFVTSSKIIVLADSDKSFGTAAFTFDIQEPSSPILEAEPKAHIRGLIPFYLHTNTTALLWFSGGEIAEISTTALANGSQAIISSDFNMKLPSNLQSISVKYQPHQTGTGDATMAFGLRRNGMLFANNHCIAKDCTSFMVSEDHLIFTTSQHLLKFVHLANVMDVEALVVPPDTPEADERCRAIERGAKLVNIVPSISALILQMPRGNLETIYPRALVLPVIRRSISQCKYKKAFLACRNHRVDMNIIHDHAPEKFLQNVGMFIDQVKKVDNIDLFLSQLREEDVSITMYQETLPQANSLTNGNQSVSKPELNTSAEKSKVNRICLTFLEILEERRATNLQNIITAHVCQNPPALEDGLFEITKLQQTLPDDVNRAVEHICFLTDVNRLYDTALGMYDLDLTLLIAQESQRDPREYLPFLQNLKKHETLRMKVDIDNHLRRHVKVLQHLRDLDDFEAFKKHMTRHELYEQAIEIFKYQEGPLNDIVRHYAQYLESKSRHKDAGVAYEFLKEYRPAAESYRLAHMWKEALSCATSVPLDPDQLQSFASVMADSLIELKDYGSAAAIHRDYLQSIETSARLYCKGYHFADAIRLIGLHKRHDLLEKVVDAGLGEGQAAITELLADMKGQLNAQVPRIRELRVKKAEEPLTFYDADIAGGVDIPDNVSLAGTDASTVGGTLFTRYTNRTGTVATNATRATSKKRMKEERKRARGKKGSVYEEEYLINSVARLIERINLIGEEVERLVLGLMRRGMRERARAVEIAMLQVIELCKDYSLEVFHTPAGEDVSRQTEKPAGGDGVMWGSMEQIHTTRAAPLIRSFERLSILGL